MYLREVQGTYLIEDYPVRQQSVHLQNDKNLMEDIIFFILFKSNNQIQNRTYNKLLTFGTTGNMKL